MAMCYKSPIDLKSHSPQIVQPTRFVPLVGLEPTDYITYLSSKPLYLFAYRGMYIQSFSNTELKLLCSAATAVVSGVKLAGSTLLPIHSSRSSRRLFKVL